MWGRRRRGAGPSGCGAEELRARRREREAALRKARRQEQLVSKRLLREDSTAEEGGQDGAEVVLDPLSEDEVLELLRGVQRGSEDRKRSLSRLCWALRIKETQQKFVRLDGSIRTLIGLFTSSLADMQMEAARCLHELSHSSDPAVAEACLPVTSYLLTYLSGHSVEFTELCLYTLGNLVVESKAVRKQLLPQGIIPVLASCIQTLADSTELPALLPAVARGRDPSAEGCSFADLNARSSTAAVFGLLDPYNCSQCECEEGGQLSFGVATGFSITPGPLLCPLFSRHEETAPLSCLVWCHKESPHEAVLEGLGYVLSQLLQAKEAPTEIIPLVLDSVLPQHMIRLVCSGLKAGIGAAVEFAWCLHYIVCSHTANMALLSLGTLPALSSLLFDLASEIPQDAPEGLELLICPVLRCLSNLLAEETGCEVQIQDERLLIALFLILQWFLQQHPFIVQECLWLLNNLTADEPFFCSALLSLDLLPALLQLLPCSQMASVLVLTVLCNIAEKGPAYCQQLHQQPALPLLLPTLVLPDPEVVGQCLELLHLLFLHWPEAAADFVRQGGHRALEQHQTTPELQERARALLDMVGQPLGASTFSPCHAMLSAFS